MIDDTSNTDVYRHQVALLEKHVRELETALKTAHEHIAAMNRVVLDALTEHDALERKQCDEIARLEVIVRGMRK